MTQRPNGIIDGETCDRDLRFDHPPVASARERRAHARAYRHWEKLRGERRLPAIADLDARDLSGFAANSVLFDLECDPGRPAVRFIGATLAEEAGAEAERPEHISVRADTLLGELACRLPLIAATAAPLDFEAEFLGPEAAPTLYRGVLLPFAGGGGRPSFVYGVVTWKTVAVELGDDIRSAVGSALSLPFASTVRSPWEIGGDAASLPNRSFAQRLAAAQTWAALAAADHAHRGASLHAALSAAHDFLLAEEAVAGGPTDEAEAAAVVSLVFGTALPEGLPSRYRRVLDRARGLRLGQGALAPMLDRYEDGIDGFLAPRPMPATADAVGNSIVVHALDIEALAAVLPGAAPAEAVSLRMVNEA